MLNKLTVHLRLRLLGRSTATARRSFFRRKKHQRGGSGSSGLGSSSSSRDSKELASFCNLSPGWYSDSGEFEILQLSVNTYNMLFLHNRFFTRRFITSFISTGRKAPISRIPSSTDNRPFGRMRC